MPATGVETSAVEDDWLPALLVLGGRIGCTGVAGAVEGAVTGEVERGLES